MADHDNDIDALLEYLGLIGIPESPRYYQAVATLVAERDSLKAKVDEGFAKRVYGHAEDLAAAMKHVHALLAERDALKQRVAELEAHPPADRDLRERLVCAIWPQMLRSFDQPSDDGSRYEWQALKAKARNEALDEADKMIAAMRKGEA